MPFATSSLEFDKVVHQLSTFASFSVGRERALALEPTSDYVEAERRQAATAEALRLADLKPDLTLGGASDIRPVVQRAEIGGLLLPNELLAVAALVRCARRWRATLTRLAHLLPTLARPAELLSDHQPILEEVTAAISDQGDVLDAASADLRRLRLAHRAAQDRVRQRLQELVSSSSIRTALQDPIVTERNGRFVVPVKAEFRSRVRGLIHDQSTSGATLFVEPLEVVELANRARQLQVECEQEVERILRALSSLVADDDSALNASVEALAELDLYLACARLAAQQGATRPRLKAGVDRASGDCLRLIEARHPLLGANAVPLSLELGADFDLLVITGPNTGGKTVALKTVGLLTLMAQAGLHLPADESSTVPVFRSVHADIGDEQSIEQSLSTFSSHVSRIVQMLRDADDRCLILLDELGAGTDPQEGSALARALLDHLRQRRVLGVATTHYSELKLFAHTTPRVENASVEFDLATLSPTYRLLIGMPGRSNALEIAARLGLPRVIVERARAAVDPESRQISDLIEQIQQDRHAAHEARQQAEAERLAIDLQREALEREAAAQRLAQQQLWSRAERESAAELRQLQREIEALRREAQRTVRDPAILNQLAVRALELQQTRPRPAQPPLPLDTLSRNRGEPSPTGQNLVVGSEVMVPSLGASGRIARLEGDEAEIHVRGMRVRLPIVDLLIAGRSSREARPVELGGGDAAVVVTVADRQVALQLDLRGQRRDEAGQELDRYLNDAYLTGLRSVRVIHGKGSGAVRQAVHELLTSHPLVRRFDLATRETGGEGATEVELIA